MTGPLQMQEEVDSHRGSQNTQHRIDEVVYTVRPGDTLSGIALAFLPPNSAVGDTVAVDVRGRSVPAHVAQLPFVSPSPPRY